MKSSIEELSEDAVTHRARRFAGEVQTRPWRALLATAVVPFVAGISVRRR